MTDSSTQPASGTVPTASAAPTPASAGSSPSPSAATGSPAHAAALDRTGLGLGLGAYLVWGLFPLLMHALVPASPLEITAQRALWSLLVCAVIVTVVRGWARLRTALSDLRTVATLALAAALIVANWLIYVYAVTSDQVNSASLGYYINPLVLVGLGVVVLGERLRRGQVVAVAIATVAVVIIGVEVGGLPWIALALAFSFGIYGLIKKRLNVDPVTGLTIETLVLAPFAAIAVWWMHHAGTLTFGTRGGDGLGIGHDLLLASTGVFTVGALLLFAGGAQRLPLNIVGLLQYLAPTIMFMLAVWHFGEPMSTGRWIGFLLVWVALIVLTVDSFRASRARTRDPREAEVEPTEPV
ncbi:EamA family transporter RarD [Demequina capsici]|uniref:EamA family transporter RarD n=1 Tax=Demequina capsici TaxID=3075620 RepID=A0AA96FEJ4_9MICO|nr:EamA family transporter RarD [Demequina sp. PMTSA13]WNM26990.1 EamA family transporter RarD [Demequina sp. PMTSA13]